VTVSCLIIDESQSFLAPATRLLSVRGHSVVGQAFSTDEALRVAKALSPRGALVDVELSNEGEIALARQPATGGSPATVILTSIRDRDELAKLIAGSGADGFVRKDALDAQAFASLIVKRNQCNVGPEPPQVT
jgi:DNA-binding NarL/FixJ family response regulator